MNVFAKRKILTEKCINGRISKENRFLLLIDGLYIQSDEKKFPGRKFFFSENTYLFEHVVKHTTLKKEVLWISLEIWMILEKEYSMTRDEVKKFIRKMFTNTYVLLNTIHLTEKTVIHEDAIQTNEQLERIFFDNDKNKA